MTKKKMLLVASVFPPEIGGIQNYVYNIAKNSKHDVTVLCPPTVNCDEFDKKQNFKIERVSPGNSFFRSLPIMYILFIFRHSRKYDVVCFAQNYWSYIGYFFKKIFRTRYIIFTYGTDIIFDCDTFSTKIYKFMVRSGLRGADIVFTLSMWGRRELEGLGIHTDRVVLLPPGVDFDFFNQTKKTTRLDLFVEKYHLRDKKVLLTVSRIYDRKGHSMVIKALPKILEKEPNVIYLVVGGPKHKQEQLERLSEEYHVRNNVIFTGVLPINMLIDCYHACDVFIMASRYLKKIEDIEGFGIVFLEANACSRPVIGGNTGGIPDAIKNGVTGYLVDSENADEIACRCIELLGNDKLRKRMGINGKKWAREHKWNVIVTKFDRILEEYSWL